MIAAAAWEALSVEGRIEYATRAVRGAVWGYSEREDFLQEAAVAAWKALQADPAAPAAHVVRAARFAALNAARGRRQTGAPERTKSSAPRAASSLDEMTVEADEDDFRLPVALVEEPESVEALDVRRAVASLDPEDRRLVWLRFWEGRTETDAARILGISRARAYQRWHERIEPALRSALAA